MITPQPAAGKTLSRVVVYPFRLKLKNFTAEYTENRIGKYVFSLCLRALMVNVGGWRPGDLRDLL